MRMFRLARPAFRNGIQLVLEAMLQSPLFLYRIELSDRQDSEQLIALSGFEIASRLSFMLWNTVPDTTLMTAAQNGQLDMLEEHRHNKRAVTSDYDVVVATNMATVRAEMFACS